MRSVRSISSVEFQPATKFAAPKRVASRLALVTGRVYSPGTRVSTTRANALVPMVIESSPSGERAYDIFSRLLMERIITINGPIDDYTCNIVNAQLLFLEQQDNSKPIFMYINSPGGVFTAGLAIYDTMQYVKSPISTICLGQAKSMASLLLAAGAKGQRMSLPHSTIMIHQPSGGYQGQAKDMTIHTERINRMSDTVNEIYVKHTGLEIDVVKKHMDRDFFLSAEEAKEFGLIDKVITRKPMALKAGANGVVGLEKPQVSDSDPQDATAF